MNGKEYALPLPVFYIVPSSFSSCVLYGTEITLYNGSEIPVQYLHVGDEVLFYDIVLHRFVKSHVVSINVSNVSGIININNGFFVFIWMERSIRIRFASKWY
jgi:hypothetical protein